MENTTVRTVILGAGAAGCVMANRLSADGHRDVLLVEAGSDMVEGRIPEVLLDAYPGGAYVDRRYTWKDLKVATDVPQADGSLTPARWKVYEQGRVMGGGTTINGQLANRGSPLDYDEWASRGATGWGWDGVLPYFRKLEHDLDFQGPLHGQGGPFPVRRVFPDSWPGHAKAVAAALEASGLPYLPDQNGECIDGHFPITISNVMERRVSASTAYLGPAVRARPNLRIQTETHAVRLLFEGRTCVGVELQTPQGLQTVRAHEVVVCCGAIHSPALLLRSGVGPASDLQDMGVEVVADRPGVGRGLMDHPSVAVASLVRPQARVNANTRRHMLVGWRYSSGIGNAPQDMYAVAASRSAWHAVGAQIGSLLLLVNKTFSNTGTVKLASRDWRREPAVQFHLLSDARDLERLSDGVLRLAALQAAPALAAVTSHHFPAVWGDKVRQVGAYSRRNKWYTDLAARLLDGPAPLRDFLLRNVVADKYTMHDIVSDERTRHQFIRDGVVGTWHPSSSCSMGQPADPMAVTDPAGRVLGIQGVRLADASIFPTVPRAALTLSVLMAAEKIADGMLREA